MSREHGFTLIELIIFIIVTGILASTILIAFSTSLSQQPSVDSNFGALQIAQKCMEWFIGNRRLGGYDSFSCPSTTTPAYCLTTGYTVMTNVACLTINTDTNYKSVTITVSGQGNASLTTFFADY